MDLRERVEVAAAFSPSRERREAFAKAFPFPTCDGIDAILDDATIGSVIVLTPPSTHLDIVGRCAARARNVLLEKPVEITTERAGALVDACERAGVTLGIVLQHRFRPAAEALAACLRGGRLGAIAGCSTTIRLWRPQGYYDEPGRGTIARDGGGVLMTQGIHALDLMLSLAGPVSEVRAFAATSPLHRMEAEDMVAAAMRFENGALGTLDATTAAYPGFPERIEIIGRNGSATLAGAGLEVAFHDGRTEAVAPTATPEGSGADPMAFPHDWHRSLHEDFLDAVEERREPRVSGREALNVHRLIDSVIAASTTGKTIQLSSPAG